MSFLDLVLDRAFVYAWIGLTALFGLSATLSSALYFSYGGQFGDLVEGLVAERVELLEELPLPQGLLFLAIFSNNATIALLSAALSFLLVVPLLVIMLNGALVGFLLSATSVEASSLGLPSAAAYFLLVPHGVLEVPALSLASSAFVGLLGGRRYVRFVVASSLLALTMLLCAALVEQVLIILVR
ncbi:MAG: stage II sporulation protein M [Acidilobaceae archaeon]